MRTWRTLEPHENQWGGKAHWWRVVCDGVMDYCAATPHDSNYEIFMDSVTRHRGRKIVEWYGAESVKEVEDRVQNGWPEGLEKIRSILGKIKLPPLPSLRRAKSRAAAGDELDMQRVWSGDLDKAWANMVPRETSGRPVNATLIVNITASWMKSPEEMFWTGACAVALCEAFRLSGRACKIVGVIAVDGFTTDSGDGLLVEVPLQEYGRATALETLVSSLCFAGFFRYQGFRVMSSIPQRHGSNYGHCTDSYPKPESIYNSWAIDVGKVYTQEGAEKVLRNFMEGKDDEDE